MENKKSLWNKNFITITILNFLIYWSFQMFPSGLPPFVKSLGGEGNILGWLNGIATISTLLIRPIAGNIADKYGRKGIFITGIIIMVIAISTYHIFPIISVILVFRFLHGVGWAFASTASNTIATDNISKDNFATSMGYFSLSVSLALAIAPAISLGINFKWVIALAIILNLLSLAGLFRIDYKAIDKIKVIENNKSLFEKNALFPSIIIFFITITYGSVITFLALYGIENKISNIGVLFFPIVAISMLLSRPLIGRLIDKHSSKIIIYPSLVFLSGSLILLSIFPNKIGFIISGIVYGISYGGLQTALQTLALIKTSKDKVGKANATFFMWFDGGIGFGSVVGGMLASSIGYGKMYGLMAILPILAGITFYFMYRKTDSII